MVNTQLSSYNCKLNWFRVKLPKLAICGLFHFGIVLMKKVFDVDLT